MELLLWNVNRGPGRGRLEWILDQPWDVAVLLEVGRDGWRRLTNAQLDCVGSIERVERDGARYSVAILNRAQGPMEVVEGPRFPGRFEERAMAVTVVHEERQWTVAGIHMPNSVSGGGKDHQPKERCFEALQSWLAGLPTTSHVAVGIDANRNDWPGDSGRQSKNAPVAQAFMRSGGEPWLYDAHLRFRGLATDRPVTYRKAGKSGYFDRWLFSPNVSVSRCEILEPQTPEGRRLSDHFAVLAQVDGS